MVTVGSEAKREGGGKRSSARSCEGIGGRGDGVKPSGSVHKRRAPCVAEYLTVAVYTIL